MMEMEIYKSLAEQVADEVMYRLKKEKEEPEVMFCKLPEEELYEDDVKKPSSYGLKELRKKFGTSSKFGMYRNENFE